MKIPAHGLIHLGVVVRDVRASAEKLARIYGIVHWDVAICDERRLTRSAVRGFASPSSFIVATGTCQTDTGAVKFALVQPLAGWSIFAEFLLTRGEGVHHICTASITADEFDRLRPWLADKGVAIAQSGRIDDALDFHFLDTRTQLGGFYVQINCPSAAGSRDMGIDETWDLTDHVPPEGPVLPLNEFRHFGVVVEDLMARVVAWRDLFGLEHWEFRNWRTEPGSLRNSTYNGAPVEHAYFTTMMTLAPNLGFELIQPTFGPSHYREDYLRTIGEGVHHLFTATLPDEAAWEAMRRRAEAADVPVVMSGELGDDFLRFYYLDTRKALPGYVTEVLHPGANAVAGRRPSFEVAMTADLSHRSS